MTPAEALALLDIQPPREVAWTSKDGTLRDDDGDKIDPRQAEPWVWALGPFGSWPETAEEAKREIAASEVWRHVDTLRIGWAIVRASGWGFGAKAVAPSRRAPTVRIRGTRMTALVAALR